MRTLPRLGMIALLALAACSQPGPPPVAETAVGAETAAPETPSAATTAGGAAPTAAAGGAAVDDLGVRFLIPTGLATGANGETVPAAGLGDPQAPAWAVYPEHRRFTLQGYTGPAEPLLPAVQVFPLEEYQAAAPVAAESITALRELLAAQPASPEDIPVLPVLNAAQLFRAQVQYLPFGGGRGVRFVSFYAQNAAPLSNPGLLYIYQGLTDDGQHLVSVTLPVSAAALDPSAPAVPFPTADAAGGLTPEAYQAYLAAIAERLNALGPADVTPNLAQLDALVQSVQVSPAP